jgi:hypothetical protein
MLSLEGGNIGADPKKHNLAREKGSQADRLFFCVSAIP